MRESIYSSNAFGVRKKYPKGIVNNKVEIKTCEDEATEFLKMINELRKKKRRKEENLFY